jgi:hypothetical protein
VYVKKNPSTDLVNDVFSTPGDVLITGSVIYQGDSIYAQSQGYTGGYPAPTYGTSTRTLDITDSAANTIYNFTGDYTTYSNINTTFSIVGGRNYFVRGRTDFYWPATANLYFVGITIDPSNDYFFEYYLDTAVDGDFTITSNSGITADFFFGVSCAGGVEATFGNVPSSTVTSGQYGTGFIATGESHVYGFDSYNLNNFVYIDGDYYAHGSTFVRGATTVTVNITTSCQTL